MELNINQIIFILGILGGLFIVINSRGKTLLDKTTTAFIQGGFSSIGYIFGLFSLYIGAFNTSPMVGGSVVGNIVMSTGTPSSIYIVVGVILVLISIYIAIK